MLRKTWRSVLLNDCTMEVFLLQVLNATLQARDILIKVACMSILVCYCSQVKIKNMYHIIATTIDVIFFANSVVLNC